MIPYVAVSNVCSRKAYKKEDDLQRRRIIEKFSQINMKRQEK